MPDGLNVDNKIMHILNNNHHIRYAMNESELSTNIHANDLSITFSKNLEPSKQCSDVDMTTNKSHGFIRRICKYKSEFFSFH